MSDQLDYINFNGELVLSEEPSIPLNSRAVMYGDGCFETLRYYRKKFLHFTDHYHRLLAGCEYLGLNCTVSELKLLNEIDKLVQANESVHADQVIRIQLWREGGSGYFSPSMETKWMINARPLPEIKKSISLKLVPTRAIPNIALSRKVKLTNSINYIQASREAQNFGFDDALMLTVDDLVSESSIANLFWVKDGVVYTPSEDCDLLPGITRGILINILENEDIPFESGHYSLSDIQEADAIFGTNSVREIIPVHKLDSVDLNPAHLTIELLTQLFNQYKSTYLK